MLMEMAGSRSCGEERSRTTGSMTENAREPNIDVDVRGRTVSNIVLSVLSSFSLP